MNATQTPLPTSDQPKRARRATAIGLTAGLLAGGAAGLFVAVPSLTSAATAPQQDTTDTTTDTTTDSTTDTAAPERGARVREALQALVDDGTITAAQADAVATHLADNLPRGGRGHGGPGRGFDGTVVADALGVTADELRTALQDGQSIADVAAAEGVDVQVVIDAMVAQAENRIAEAVTEGRLSQEEADAKLADLEARITERVNTAGPLMGGRGDRGGMGGGMGRMGDAPADAASLDT